MLPYITLELESACRLQNNIFKEIAQSTVLIERKPNGLSMIRYPLTLNKVVKEVCRGLKDSRQRHRNRMFECFPTEKQATAIMRYEGW